MKKLFIFILLVLILLFLYGKFIEINNFKIKEYTIKSNKIPESFKELKIVHFSDILYKKTTSDKNMETLVTNINNEEADIVIFSGDLLTKNEKYNEKDIEKITKIMKDIKSSLFKFAIIGDNDLEQIDIYKKILSNSNFILLDNQNKLVFYKELTPINIIGLNRIDNIENLLKSDYENLYNLVIINKPDKAKKLSKYNIDTILSGHSLGGIINIPYYGGLIKRDGAKEYINDYYKINKSELFVSNGIGYEKFEFRLFNNPSINVYRFTK